MLVSTSTWCLTCDDFAEFVGAMIPTDKVGEPDDDQTQDGGEDAEPLAGCQLASQERHGEHASEYNDGSAQHLEAGGAGHIESWKRQIERPVDQGQVAEKQEYLSVIITFSQTKDPWRGRSLIVCDSNIGNSVRTPSQIDAT